SAFAGTSSRIAGNTTVNAAIISGIVPTAAAGGDGSYSDGAENFPRFLENWSNATLTYYGSMVELYQSAQSTGEWGKANVYSPPRGWDYSGHAAQLTLQPTGKDQAEARISKVTLSQPASFDQETVRKLVQEVMASVPNGTTHIQLVSQEKNPLMIERKETFS